MTLTLSFPVMAIMLFVVATQTWAWTRSKASDWLVTSNRAIAVFCMTFLDLLFIAIVGGIWIW